MILLAIAAGASVLYGMHLFDRLVRWEYDHYRDLWERDGKPRGFLWQAEECADISSTLAMKERQLEWLFKAPCWIVRSAECRRWLMKMRLLSGAWAAVVVVLVSGVVARILGW